MATQKQISDVILHLANKFLEYLNTEYLNIYLFSTSYSSLLRHLLALVISKPDLCEDGSVSKQIFISDIQISFYHISCFISVCPFIRRCVEGIICRKFAQHIVCFGL